MNDSPISSRESLGYLTVRAFTAGEALPVVGATVRITDGGDGLINEEIVRMTGISGLTEAIGLPAPSASLSLTPSLGRPYAIYDLEVTHPDFYPFTANAVPVFSGIVSLQPVNLIPLTLYGSASLQPSFIDPIYENEALRSGKEE